jgi:hypothetical protein
LKTVKREKKGRGLFNNHSNIAYEKGLRKVKPYFFEYKSYAKGRWLGRKLLEVFSTEFRDRSADYYVSRMNKTKTNSSSMLDIEICD